MTEVLGLDRRSRLRELVRAAVSEVDKAALLFEVARPAQEGAEVQARFAGTFAGHAFVALRQAAIDRAALALTGLWEKSEKGNLRFLDIEHEMADARVRRALIELHASFVSDRERRWQLASQAEIAKEPWLKELSDRAIANAPVDVERRVGRLIDQFTSFARWLRTRRVRSSLDSLSAYRHERLAHREIKRHPSKPHVAPAPHTDLEQLLWMSKRLVE